MKTKIKRTTVKCYESFFFNQVVITISFEYKIKPKTREMNRLIPLPIKKNKTLMPGMGVHAFNPSTWEAEAGEFLSSRPAWAE
jgi:major histocompatibility complex class I